MADTSLSGSGWCWMADRLPPFQAVSCDSLLFTRHWATALLDAGEPNPSHTALLGMSFKENSPLAARQGFPSALTGASSLKGLWELCRSLFAGFFLLAHFYFFKYSGI